MKILFCVSSIGLGHATRSAKLCEEIVKKKSAEVYFLTAEPSLSYIRIQKKKVVEESKNLKSLSAFIEELIEDGKLKFKVLPILKFFVSLAKNYRIFMNTIKKEKFDLIICDEFWEVFLFQKSHHHKIIFISDIYEFNIRYLDIFSKIFIKFLNIVLKAFYNKFDSLFYGDCRLCIGYPAIYGKREIKIEEKMRRIRKYRKDRVVLVSVGGTSSGKDLIEKIIRTASTLKNIKFKIVCGPRIKLESDIVKNLGNIEIIEFTDKMLKYYLEADLVICQAGLSTLLEVSTLNKKAIVFPIKNHIEQLENTNKIKSNNIIVLDREISIEELNRIIQSILNRNSLEKSLDEALNKNNLVKVNTINMNGIKNAYKVISWRYLTKQKK